MEITLVDGRKAEVLGMISEKLCRIRLEDGREVPWPNDKIKYPEQEGEETLKAVQIPAIQRLKEYEDDWRVLNGFDHLQIKQENERSMFYLLWGEAYQEFKAKWGLTLS